MASRKRKASSDEKGSAPELPVAEASADVLVPQEFFSSSAWEVKPGKLKPNPARTQLLQQLFGTASFRKLLKQLEKEEPLEFGRDLNAARYKDGKRETPNAQVADSKTVWGLYKEGCTLQVHQPQRYCDKLAAICSGLEQQLGCLVGINAYITPAGTQGLAPHHDDVEIFVCQTEGTKRWRLYNPVNAFALPAQPSGDLAEADLGKPIMDVTLKVGDVLYMPRGTVHQATAQKEASTHLTISTYQNFSLGTLAQAVLHSAMQGQDEPVCLPLSLRSGLPPGFLYSHGFQADTLSGVSQRQHVPSTPPQVGAKPASSIQQQLAAGLRALADRIETQPELISKAADLMSVDFMSSRAPPVQASLSPRGAEPTMGDAVKCRAAHAFRLVKFDAPEADMGVPLVKVVSCLSNSIEDHMMGEEQAPAFEDAQHQHNGSCCHDEDCGHSKGNGLHQHQNQDACNSKEASSSKEEKMNGMEEDDEEDESEDEEEEDESEHEEEEDESEHEEEVGLADLVFPAIYSTALAQLLCAKTQPIRVADIELEGDDVKLDLAVTLWHEGIVTVQPEAQGKPAKRSKK